jgi:hypothetical protein
MLKDGAPIWQKVEDEGFANCLFKGESYGPGSIEQIENTKQLIVCNTDGQWAIAPGSSNCLFKGQYYGPGAVEEVSSKKQLIVCNKDGQWALAPGSVE